MLIPAASAHTALNAKHLHVDPCSVGAHRVELQSTCAQVAIALSSAPLMGAQRRSQAATIGPAGAPWRRLAALCVTWSVRSSVRVRIHTHAFAHSYAHGYAHVHVHAHAHVVKTSVHMHRYVPDRFTCAFCQCDCDPTRKFIVSCPLKHPYSDPRSQHFLMPPGNLRRAAPMY